ncbi:MAG: hypothetical protein L0Z63_08935 [Actinobacteria bacterium]|nr:hypothetical protein [Actinomycetota bacterium]
MRRLLAGVMLVAACSPAETAGTTTTSDIPTTVITATTTTPDATTTPLETTTTTTSPVSTTTTDPGLAGDWADEPLITTGFGALGWWDGSGWARAEEYDALPVVGGEDYQLISVMASGVIVGGPQALVCDPLELLGVVFDEDVDQLGEWPGPYGVALSAPWGVQPHLFEPVTPDDSHAAYASDLLASRGLDVPDPQIKQVFRTDLEGDGVNEVLIVAEDIQGGYFPNEGDYSILFLRKVIGGGVETAVIGESVMTNDTDFPVAFSVGGVGDLNGDGKMEIVVSAAYYEGLGVEVWEYVDDDIGPTPVLSVGCGS